LRDFFRDFDFFFFLIILVIFFFDFFFRRKVYEIFLSTLPLAQEYFLTFALHRGSCIQIIATM